MSQIMMIRKKRVKDLKKGDVFVYNLIEWRVYKITDRIYYCRNCEKGGWGDSFGLKNEMMVEYLGTRVDINKLKNNDDDNE